MSKEQEEVLSLNLDWNLNDNNQLYFKSIYNHRDDWENRFRMRVGKVLIWMI